MDKQCKNLILVITDKISGTLTNGSQVMALALLKALSKSHYLKIIVQQNEEPVAGLNAEIFELQLDDERLGEKIQPFISETTSLVYHFGATLFSAHLATIIYSLAPNIPIINHFQLVLPEYARNEGYSEEQSSELEYYCRFVAENAITNIFPSFSELSQVIRLGWQVQNANNLVVKNAYVPEPEQGAVSLNGASVNFMAAGRFSDYVKGADLVYRAFSAYYAEDPLAHLYIAGDEPRFTELLNGLPPTAWTYLGWLSRTDLHAQLKAVDVLIVPSRYEPFGLIAVEAMAMGTPVIAMAIGGLAEIIHHEHTGWLCNPLEGSLGIKHAMKKAASQKHKLQEMGELSIGMVEEEYSLSKMTREIRKIFDNTLSAGSLY